MALMKQLNCFSCH